MGLSGRGVCCVCWLSVCVCVPLAGKVTVHFRYQCSSCAQKVKPCCMWERTTHPLRTVKMKLATVGELKHPANNCYAFTTTYKHAHWLCKFSALHCVTIILWVLWLALLWLQLRISWCSVDLTAVSVYTYFNSGFILHFNVLYVFLIKLSKPGS